MFKENRLAVQLVFAGLIVITSLGALWIASGLYLRWRSNHSKGIRLLADQIRVDVMQARRSENNFLLYDTSSADFYETAVKAGVRSKSDSLLNHSLKMKELQQRLTELSKRVEDDRLRSLAMNVREYKDNFAKLVESYHERGYKDWGLVGQWRIAAHAIEQYAVKTDDTNLHIALLQLRRHEKDYLLRGAEYEHAVRDGIAQLQQWGGDAAHTPHLAAATEKYLTAFDNYVAIERRIGSTEHEGLRGQTRMTAQAVEESAAELASQAGIIEQRANRRQLIFSLAILFSGIVLGGVVFHRVAKSIVRPLSELRDVAMCLGHGNLEPRVYIKAQNEVGDLAEAFNRLLDKLQLAFEHERRFSDDAAHQLRTPLTIIQGEIDVALRQPRSPTEYETCLRKISQVNREMSQIVDALLFLARGSQESFSDTVEHIELSNWTPQFIQRYDDHPRRADIRWIVEDHAYVKSSSLLLSQMLDNLIRNAIRYSSTGNEITLEVKACNEHVEIAVNDRGVGVPLSEHESIFEPFYRSTTTHQMARGGTGLGLTVARRIAEAIGGTLVCRSREGGGSTFAMTLPVCFSNHQRNKIA